MEVKRRLSYMIKNKDELRDKYTDFYIPRYKKYLLKNTDKMKRFQVYLVVSLLILLPAWHFSISYATHSQAHIKITRGGFSPGSIDPVQWQIEPTYDTDKALDRINKQSSTFRPDLLNKVVDLEELTKLPGKIAVYRFASPGDLGKILLTYTYVSPIPIVKAVGIQWVEGSEQLFVKNVKTFVFPMSPMNIADTADV